MNQKHAVALQYQSADQLPLVLAHGLGEIAEQLLSLAKAQGIPITENPELSSILKAVTPGKPVSERSLKLVAQVISFLYFCDEKFRSKHQFLAEALESSAK